MKILLTGANGYIGGRLLHVLINKGYEVICLVRDIRRIRIENSLKEHVTFFEADLQDEESLKDLPNDIDVAYYMVHSMGSSYKNFASLEEITALNFANAVGKTRARQIIYLSGITNDDKLSEHLQSRRKVEEILMEGPVPVTILRAAIIIGSGSASFEIIRDLVEKLPVMIAPRWLKTRCQPIALNNVLEYLEGVVLKEETYNQIFDIGGPDVLTYRQMLFGFAEVRRLKRYIISVPVLSPRLSSLWLYFVTNTSFSLARSLVDSMRNEVIVQKTGIQEIVPVQLISYKQAVNRGFAAIEQNEVIPSWKDALNGNKNSAGFEEYGEVPVHGCFRDVRKVPVKKSRQEVIENIWKIGGETGWYYGNILWQFRGLFDKMLGGVGLRRGRRSPDELVPGDTLDCWRVLVADKEKPRLLLFAEMKLPGAAWLEFTIIRENEQYVLLQTATFRPKGVSGRLYWYSVLPFHHFIFRGMAHGIAAKN